MYFLKPLFDPRLAEHTRHLELTLERELGLLSLKQDTTNQYHEGLKQTHKETNRLLVPLFTEIQQTKLGPTGKKHASSEGFGFIRARKISWHWQEKYSLRTCTGNKLPLIFDKSF